MEISTILILLFLINAILHLIQPFIFGFNKITTPVFIWGFLLLDVAFLWWNDPSRIWLKWGSFLLPIVGALILSSQLKTSTNPKWLDYSILILDVIIVGLMVKVLFF